MYISVNPNVKFSSLKLLTLESLHKSKTFTATREGNFKTILRKLEGIRQITNSNQ